MWSETNPLYRDSEIGSLNTTITYTPPSGAVISYVSTTYPAQDRFTVTDTPTGIVVETVDDNLVGLFYIDYIDYLDENYNSVRVDDWDDVPTGAKVYDYKPDSVESYSYKIDCICNWINSVGAPQVAQISYDVIIFQDYTSNQESLKEAINNEVQRSIDAGC